jgi:hypothetical protein
VVLQRFLCRGNRTNLPPSTPDHPIEPPARAIGSERSALRVLPAALVRAFVAVPTGTNVKGHPGVGVALNSVNVRRRPTLPRPPGRSTIGAGGLNFQVRNGDWVFPRRYGHRNSMRTHVNQHKATHGLGLTVFREPYSERESSRYIAHCCQWYPHSPIERGWVCVTSPRPISTSQLHTLPRFHFWPINPVVYWGPYPVNPVGDLILKRASRLDAFSGYHSRT